MKFSIFRIVSKKNIFILYLTDHLRIILEKYKFILLLHTILECIGRCSLRQPSQSERTSFKQTHSYALFTLHNSMQNLSAVHKTNSSIGLILCPPCVVTVNSFQLIFYHYSMEKHALSCTRQRVEPRAQNHVLSRDLSDCLRDEPLFFFVHLLIFSFRLDLNRWQLFFEYGILIYRSVCFKIETFFPFQVLPNLIK